MKFAGTLLGTHRSRAVAIVAGLVALLGVTAVAIAALPKPRHASIVPLRSIGGVKLDMTKAQVVDKWGAPDMCDTPNRGTVTCTWTQRGTLDYPPQGAVTEIHKGHVCWVYIRAGIDRQGGLTITRFKDWRTKAGIGLGSTLKAVKRKYGKLYLQRHGDTFSFSSGYKGESLKRVAEISLRGSGPCYTV